MDEYKFFIKLYIITYNNDKILNRALESLYESDFFNYSNTQVNIINNYSSINIDNKYNKVNIINNETRGDNFNPNLSENHNQAILFGFNDLNNPDSEIVVHTHNDIIFDNFWVKSLIKCMKKYTFVVGSIGDQFVAYKADAVKKIGLWDENYIGIFHKECDYFLRAILFNNEESYINDIVHGRIHNNQINYTFDLLSKHTRCEQQKKIKLASNSFSVRNLSEKYFYYKWDGTAEGIKVSNKWLTNWDDINLKNKLKKSPFKVKLFLKYPFFEKKILTLKQQNYFL